MSKALHPGGDPRRKRHLAELTSEASWAWLAVVGLLILVWGGVAWLTLPEILSSDDPDDVPEISLAADQDLQYDVRQLGSDGTRFFLYPVSAVERARVLVQRDSGGVLRVALATCRACYSYRGLHHVKNGQLICGRCKHAMRVGDPDERLTSRQGCVAPPLPFSIKNDVLVVPGRGIADQIKAAASQ